MIRFAIFITLMAAAMSMSAQRTTRPRLKANPQYTAAVASQHETADTIDFDSIPAHLQPTISGYEKSLRSTTESMFITNHLPAAIEAVSLTIDYLDMHGRQLHQRTETLRQDVPPGQTRMLKLTSWDKQKVWHYRLSDPPRTKGQATPYDVKITINYIVASMPTPQQQDTGVEEPAQ